MLTKGIGGATAKEIKEIEFELNGIALSVQAHRQKSGMSQEKLAEILDINVNTIKYIEQGRRLPSLPMLIRICKKIGLTLSIPSRRKQDDK